MRYGYFNRFNYNDPVLKKRRRAAKIRLLGGLLGITVLSGAAVYIFFFSTLFEIRDITLDGLVTVDSGLVMARLSEVMNRNLAGFIPVGRNIFYFGTDLISGDFLRRWPQLASVSVSKEMPHGIKITFSERELAGVWCAGIDGGCVYFDASGYMWGSALRSSGSLVLVIEDERQAEPAFDAEYFRAISRAVIRLKELEVGAKSVRIAGSDFRDFSVFSYRGFPVLFSLDTDIDSQADALRLFLEQKAPKDWKPEYVDLRISGKIYYK